MTPNKGESKEAFLKRATDGGMDADAAQKAWMDGCDPAMGSTYADVKEGETKEVYVARFMTEAQAIATYPTEEGRKGAAEVKFAAHALAKKEDTIEYGEMLGVEIFSTGTWSGSKKVTVTEADLNEMVRAWNDVNDKVTGYRPPLKLGHDDAQKFIGQHKGSGAPALGWVHNLRRIGNKVVADFKDVPSKLLDMIRQKRYNSVSIEMLPNLEFDGKNYSTVLTAVAILGAELPAVKGLKELSATLGFASAQSVTLSQKEEDTNMVTYTQEQHDALVAAAVGKAKTEFEAAQTGVVTKLQGDLTAAKARAETAEAALTQFKSEAETAEIVAFVDKSISEGKVMPVEKDGLVAVGKSMAGGAKVRMGEKETSGLDAFKDMITKRPVAVNFRQHLRGGSDRDQGEAASVTVTARANEKVTKAGGADKLSFKMAVEAVLTEDPALKQRYFQEI